MDYNEGITAQNVKWSVWICTGSNGQFSFLYLSYVSDQSGNYFITLVANDLNIYGFNNNRNYDLNTAYPIELVFLSGPIVGELGCRTCFNGIKIRGFLNTANSSGNTGINNVLSLAMRAEDASTPLFTLSKNLLNAFNFGGFTSALDLYQGLNITSEKVYLYFTLFTLNSVTFNRFDFFGNTLFRTRTYPYNIINNCVAGSIGSGW